MATQNLFEKYGIKEVADVTFYRIEKKEETYESQREFSVASVLKGAVELRTVYPMIDGVGSDEGFEAYVFTDANIITGANYDCDDNITATITVKGKFDTTSSNSDAYETSYEYRQVTPESGDSPQAKGWYEYDSTSDQYVASTDSTVDTEDTYYERVTVGSFKDSYTKSYTFYQLQNLSGVSFTSGYPIYMNEETQIPIASTVVASDYEVGSTEATFITFTKVSANTRTGKATYSFKVSYGDVTLTNSTDAETGVYNDSTAVIPDAKLPVGTHEFTYPQQAFMLFAKHQNLIAKTGTRYQFADVDSQMGNLAFIDEYAAGPNSTEQVVILGLAGTTSSTYNVDEVNEALKALTTTYKAKAYDVSYGTFAELVVEDEMGYYNPKFLGNAYDKANGVIEPFAGGSNDTVADAQAEYREWSTDNRGCDIAIANATMWGNNVHYSINDAIDALRQKKLLLDAAESSGMSGIEDIFGGYKVTSDADPLVTTEDTDTTYNDNYSYKAGVTSLETTSKYSLESVLDALTEIGYNASAVGKNIRVNYAENASNRAIYVKVSGAIDTAAGAHIYLLHNKNYRMLAADENGIFSFEDKKGNTLYYQDKIFKKVEWLALVIIGNKGLIYVVNRHGTKTDDRVAWMVNDNGYITDAGAATLVKNGLIHTTDVTVNNETFEATAEVVGLKIRKITKTVNRYTPVLFLDTLKVTNIEQTAEEVYATGGRGNSNLIGWDFGKEITLHFEDALFTPASLSATFGAYEDNDFRTGVKEVKELDRTEKVVAKRSFIVPAGNSNGTPTEADHTAQAVYINPDTMEPYQDGTPIAEGEVYLKWTRSIAYEGNSLGHKIEISADKFPGTYKIVGDTFVRSKATGEDERFQFVVNQAKMGSEQSIELSADGDPVVFNMDITVLRPENGSMMQFIQYNVVENTEENDGSTMVKGTENLNLLDDAELFKVSTEGAIDETYIGATEY